jgi:hypothetical protein
MFGIEKELATPPLAERSSMACTALCVTLRSIGNFASSRAIQLGLHSIIDFFFFFLSLWIYLWLAETSQQPISQTTWLKVTPHCNHCNHYVWH